MEQAIEGEVFKGVHWEPFKIARGPRKGMLCLKNDEIFANDPVIKESF